MVSVFWDKSSRDSETRFYNNGGEALEQIAQRGGGCPLLGDFQNQAGPGSGQLDLSVDVPVHRRGIRLSDL